MAGSAKHSPSRPPSFGQSEMASYAWQSSELAAALMQLGKGALTTMVFSRRQAQNVQNDQADSVLRSFKEWLGQEARAGRLALHPDANEYSDKPDDTTGTEFYFSPSITPSIDPNYQQANFHSDRISSCRRSIGRRVFRTLAWGFIVVVIVSAALAWQSSDDQTKQMVRVWGKSLSPLLSVHDSHIAPRYWPSSGARFQTSGDAGYGASASTYQSIRTGVGSGRTDRATPA